ncbi:MAG: efflux RND transporter periplasmic adaptor subunit [Candidatus Sungbacteria bacterium]|uniref:Efflux RND transporter periplasmic adaptor subunit n=1 Tax=Candidatus Sungiibacteriota bacterium TaxID=2750080 RepID=A0A931WN26_9BACT|nr:efflux RND transporter periplasmic adaptor subunit [Candidatus Sungbacteria bacterium]
MKKILGILKAKMWLTLGVLIIVGGGVTYFALRSSGPQRQLLKAEIRDVVQVVTVTGSVKAASTIDLEFLTSGRVVSRPRAVGKEVRRGEVLMALDTRDTDIQIAKAKAALEGSQAKLDQLKAGATPETIRQLQNAVSASLAGALLALDTAITKADKALVTLRADVFLQNNAVRADFFLSPDSTVANAEKQKVAAEAAVLELHELRNGVTVDPADQAQLEKVLKRVPTLFDSVRVVLVTSSDLLRRVISPVIPQSTINTYLTDIATVRSEFDTSMISLANAISAIQSAKDALRVKQEPPRQDDLDILAAGVNSAEADLALWEKQKSDTVLVAPVDGVLTDLKYEIGEIARVNAIAASMISSGGVEIEVNVPEVDIAKVAVGNPVAITLDALPGEKFFGKVIHIDPAETVVDGVTSYKVKISFDARDPRIKTGTTANLDIETLHRSRVLTLPQFAVVESDSGTFVRKLVNGQATEIPVSLGIRSSDGYVEVLSGVNEGEEVLNAGLKTN